MKTILIPTDFSENAQNAAKYAISLFGGDKSNKFILLNAYDLLFSNPEVIVPVFEMMKEDSTKRLGQEKDYLSKLPEAQGLDIEIACIQGEIVGEVCKYATKLKVDYVIMGTKGASGLKETFMGSNAASLIKKAQCPVIVVPEEAQFKKPRKVIFATDYNGLKNMEELEALKHLVTEYNAELTLLNVVKPGDMTDANQAVQGLRLNSYFAPAPIKFEFIEEQGVESGINQFLESGQYDLLALVERRLGFLENLFHKSVSKQLAYHTSVPILVMHDNKS